jgi:predicted unusual protein kinase regulating ubiquinone biosynthesis (AarF/ABC1/UbiB family)
MQNNYNETNNYSKRLSRYTNVGKEVGKFTTKFLVNSIISDNKSGKNAVALKTALGSLKGPLMKIAQLLSTIPGALPPEYTEELSQLQNMAPPMGKGFVRRRMNTELGLDWADNFINFEYNPFAAASLGQVHKAKTKDENDVVCKLQYPNMISAVEADLKQLDLIFKINKNLDPATMSVTHL